ncbi:hypothetical protein ScPMuIL_007449 [Solemya velum]
MLSRFLSLFNGGMRAYKVQDVRREIRIGITAKNFNELLEKGCEKLELDPEEVTVVIEDDGTLVNDDAFFKKLPTQTVFVFLRQGQSWRGAGALIHDALSKLSCATRRTEIAEQIRHFLEDENAPEKIHIISQYLELLETDVEAEERYEDEDWFDGLNKRYKSKSEVMRHNAQTRIRSYYGTAKEQVEKECDSATRETLFDILDAMNDELRKKDFHASYFDRRAGPKERLCDKKGWFKCEGPFDKASCEKFHTINPYASKGYRQLFGLWNLDHIIEKSREVIPGLIEAAKRAPKGKEVDWHFIYSLLFTKKNLKLVQIACHKKAARGTDNIKFKDFYKS